MNPSIDNCLHSSLRRQLTGRCCIVGDVEKIGQQRYGFPFIGVTADDKLLQAFDVNLGRFQQTDAGGALQ